MIGLAPIFASCVVLQRQLDQFQCPLDHPLEAAKVIEAELAGRRWGLEALDHRVVDIGKIELADRALGEHPQYTFGVASFDRVADPVLDLAALQDMQAAPDFDHAHVLVLQPHHADPEFLRPHSTGRQLDLVALGLDK